MNADCTHDGLSQQRVQPQKNCKCANSNLSQERGSPQSCVPSVGRFDFLKVPGKLHCTVFVTELLGNDFEKLRIIDISDIVKIQPMKQIVDEQTPRQSWHGELP